MNKRILIVAGFFPYPADFGGAVDVYGRLVALKKLGYTIDIVCTCKTQPISEHITKLKEIVEKIYIVPRKNRLMDMLSLTPLQVLSRKALKDIAFEHDYSLVIMESEIMGVALKNKSFRANRIVIRVHNDEAKYFRQLGSSTGNILKKLYYYTDAFKLKRYSEKIIPHADKLWFISTDEMEAFRRTHKYSAKAEHLPAPIQQEPVVQNLDGKTVLFIGSLFMPNNINAIEWYLDKVHQKIAADYADYELLIVGSTGDADEVQLKKMYGSINNVRLLLNVPNLTQVYKEAAVFINPMQYGTGVKLKSVNGIMNGLPLVSTSIGSEGIGLEEGEMYLLANTPEDFYNAIRHIFTAPKEDSAAMVSKAQAFIAKNDYTTVLKQKTDDLIA